MLTLPSRPRRHRDAVDVSAEHDDDEVGEHERAAERQQRLVEVAAAAPAARVMPASTPPHAAPAASAATSAATNAAQVASSPMSA